MAKDLKQTVEQNLIAVEDKPATKVSILTELSEISGLTKKQIDALLFQQFPKIIENHLQKGHVFTMPGLFKVYPVVKPGTPERKGTNPFTKELTVFKAKPSYRTVRLKALKRLKEMAGGDITE